MDRSLEQQVTQAFKQTLKPEDTLILVTHKIEMLELVDRLIVIANHKIILDGPKEQVISQLQNPQPTMSPGQEKHS
jgi:ATP-binding cassette subfamily C protein LapB